MRSGNFRTAIVVAVSGALVVAGLIFFFALPAYQASIKTGEKLVETESQVQAQYASRKKLSETTESLKFARQITEKLRDQFLPDGAELELITAVEAVGERQGVVTKLMMSPGSGEQGLAEYDRSFTLSIAGPYSKVMDALVDFERLPYLATYDSLTLSAGSGNNGAAEAPLTLELRGFVAKEPQNL